MRTREIAVGLLLSAGLAGIVALTVPSPEPLAPAAAVAMVPPAAARPSRRPQPTAATTASVPAPSIVAGQPNSQWRDLHARYVRAPSLRAFFYDAMRKPGDGAYYYAMNVLQTCRLALEKTPAELPQQSRRREAALELLRRCDFTEQGLEDAERELGAARNLDMRTDALLGSLFDYLAADGPQGRAAMLRAAFEQGNPDVIASLVAPAIQARAPAASPDEPDFTARGVPFGAALVACRLGADCGPGAVRTLELCMQLGWCAESVPAALRQGLGRHFTALDRLATQVANEVRRGDAARLVTPH